MIKRDFTSMFDELRGTSEAFAKICTEDELRQVLQIRQTNGQLKNFEHTEMSFGIIKKMLPATERHNQRGNGSPGPP